MENHGRKIYWVSTYFLFSTFSLLSFSPSIFIPLTFPLDFPRSKWSRKSEETFILSNLYYTLVPYILLFFFFVGLPCPFDHDFWEPIIALVFHDLSQLDHDIVAHKLQYLPKLFILSSSSSSSSSFSFFFFSFFFFQVALTPNYQ